MGSNEMSNPMRWTYYQAAFKLASCGAHVSPPDFFQPFEALSSHASHVESQKNTYHVDWQVVGSQAFFFVGIPIVG